MRYQVLVFSGCIPVYAGTLWTDSLGIEFNMSRRDQESLEAIGSCHPKCSVSGESFNIIDTQVPTSIN